MKLLYDGGAGITTVRVALVSSVDFGDVDGTRNAVETAAKVLKQAYARVRKVVWG